MQVRLMGVIVSEPLECSLTGSIKRGPDYRPGVPGFPRCSDGCAKFPVRILYLLPCSDDSTKMHGVPGLVFSRPEILKPCFVFVPATELGHSLFHLTSSHKILVAGDLHG